MTHDFPETRDSLIAQVRDPLNREAWDQFASICRPVIYRLARRKGLQDADAQDLCLLYTSPSPRDQRGSRMPSSA